MNRNCSLASPSRIHPSMYKPLVGTKGMLSAKVSLTISRGPKSLFEYALSQMMGNSLAVEKEQ